MGIEDSQPEEQKKGNESESPKGPEIPLEGDTETSESQELSDNIQEVQTDTSEFVGPIMVQQMDISKHIQEHLENEDLKKKAIRRFEIIKKLSESEDIDFDVVIEQMEKHIRKSGKVDISKIDFSKINPIVDAIYKHKYPPNIFEKGFNKFVILMYVFILAGSGVLYEKMMSEKNVRDALNDHVSKELVTNMKKTHAEVVTGLSREISDLQSQIADINRKLDGSIAKSVHAEVQKKYEEIMLENKKKMDSMEGEMNEQDAKIMRLEARISTLRAELTILQRRLEGK